MKTVAVIGAGASGLTAIKCCLDEGLQPTCFERTDDIGGLWNYKEGVQEGQACVMKSTVINTSKEMMCYSDFPIPAEFPIYMHNKHVQQYFRLYSEKFNLQKYIKFSTQVLDVSQAADFSVSGRWKLTLRDNKTNRTESQIFDAVLVCTGHHADKNVPTFPGQEDFRGKIIHTHDYRNMSGYEGKRVVIIGLGNSGGDIAVELSRIASQVYVSTRRGTWVNYRISDNGMPLDMVYNTRLLQFLVSVVPESVVDQEARRRLNSKFDHAAYCLEPKEGPFSHHTFVNDDIANRIACGSIVVKPNIKKFTENGVEFDNGTSVEGIDVVFLATGYIFGFPFIDKSVIEVKENHVDLYKYMFPPELAKMTLAVVGFIQPQGALMPISELQCRLATRVFKGDINLPQKEEMWRDVREKQTAMARQFVASQRHTIQVKYVGYMDELARLNGCKPNLVKLMVTDPVLAFRCFVGPCTPYQYRLEGPGLWQGARHAILTQWDRTLGALKTRPLGFERKWTLNTGDINLPQKEEMWRDVREKQTAMARQFVASQRHTIQVKYVGYMDELARLNGCKPNLVKLMVTDPVLAFRCFVGPCTPYQYRLEGPGLWQGARHAILTQWDRTLGALKTRPLGFERKWTLNTVHYVLILSLIVACILSWFIMQ